MVMRLPVLVVAFSLLAILVSRADGNTSDTEKQLLDAMAHKPGFESLP